MASADVREEDPVSGEEPPHPSSTISTILHPPNLEELTCAICLHLLVQPVSLRCGHTFCAQCIAAALPTTSSCPLCRAPGGSLPAVNLLLERLISHAFPRETADRLLELKRRRVHAPPENVHLRRTCFGVPNWCSSSALSRARARVVDFLCAVQEWVYE